MTLCTHRRCLVLLGVAMGSVVGCQRDDQPADVRVVTVWAHQGRELENAAMRGIVAAFNDAHHAEDLRAEIHFFPDRQYADKVSIASATGRLPDLLDIDGPYVGPWAAEGLLQPIDDLITEPLREDFLPSVLAQGTFGGRLYSLGAFESALVVYYNRDIIERAGLSPPERHAEAWTWEEFTAALRRASTHAKIPLSLHMDDPGDEWITYAFSPLIWSS
ncbi:MAG: extracellular solute-binding protein, partial [bacterium]|nr:extracellular solute-binding protein [bacterium]